MPSKWKGYVVLAAAVVMQTCLGGIYAWTVFCNPLQKLYGYKDWQTQFVFGTCMLTFTVSLIFTGRLQDRIGPRPLAVASGILLGLGYMTAWLGGSNFTLLWLGSGVICGLAIGAGYVCPIATAVKWFPDRRGLVAGLAVAGYGAAAIILMTVADRLLAAGWRVLDIFALAGAVYCPVVILAGLLLFLPGPVERHATRDFRRRALLAQPRFWWLFGAMFAATCPGLIFIGNLKKITLFLGNTEATAYWALVTMAVGNTAGRVLWGRVYDWVRGRRAVLILQASVIVASILVLVVGSNAGPFLAAAFLVGFCYGGNFGIFAPETARAYGPAVFGTVYPLVILSHGITGVVGPSIVGRLFDATGSYTPGLIGGGIVTLIGLIGCAIWARRERADLRSCG